MHARTYSNLTISDQYYSKRDELTIFEDTYNSIHQTTNDSVLDNAHLIYPPKTFQFRRFYIHAHARRRAFQPTYTYIS